MGRGRPRIGPAGVVAALIALAATGPAGCATYSDHVVKVTDAVTAGDYDGGLPALNAMLGVESVDELPDQWSGDRPLAALERGSLQQALGSYRGSTRDLAAAEQELELLDLSTDPFGTLGSYIYSDSVKTYRTPPSERLALNPVNLLNYLAVGDLDGAAVEARRFQVMRDYLASENITVDGPATFGTYLAGFVFECRGEGDRALRYYEEALTGGPLESLQAPVGRLARANPYRGPHLSAMLARGATTEPAVGHDGELLVVLSLGRVPYKVPERIPVGAAIGIAGAYVSGDIDWLKYGAGKVIVYPELVSTPSTLGPARVRVDGNDVVMEQLADIGATTRKEYEEAKPKIVAAALLRLATRGALAEGVRVGGQQDTDLLGDLLSIVVETAMVVLDRPDTRSWTMLADRVLVARVPATPGLHSVEVSFDGTPDATSSLTVEVPPRGCATAVVTEPR